MSVYEKNPTLVVGGVANDLIQTQVPIYGSSRIGLYDPEVDLTTTTTVSSTFARRFLKQKQYELTNHLGNVLTTISDRKLKNASGAIAYSAEIISAQDYYPFGMIMPGRNSNPDKYRFGFNGQERLDDELGFGNFLLAENWMYSSSLARRFEKDPVVSPHLSPYACFANNPIWFKDFNGADTSIANNNKGNVIVWITDSGDEVDYKKEANQQNWDIIEAKNAKEANSRLKEYSKVNKINNLVIRTHGYDRTAGSSFAMEGFNVDAKDVNNYVNGKEIPPSKKEFLDGLSAMQNMVETGGAVYYTACNAGYDRKLVGAMGGLLLKNDNKNVSLYFNTGRSQYDKPQFSFNSRSNQSTLFDQPLLHPSTSGSIWISINKSQQSLIFHFWKTSPGLKADDKNPIGNYIYKK